MPAAEFVEWQAYFRIYPFTFEAAEHQAAKIMYYIFNTAGRQLKPIKDHTEFLPSYMIEHKEIIFRQKSLQEQYQEMAAFVSKLKQFEKTKTL